MSDKQPIILITNDDGITAPGLKALVFAMKELGKVVVVAPDKPQSGMGHAITIEEPIRLDKIEMWEDIETYQCSGTPADCVKLAKDVILHRKPDLCVSGINHGSNASINVIYSGTMSAAVEAAIEGIPSVGFSLRDYNFNADFSDASEYAIKIAKSVLSFGLPKGVLLNVNVPLMPQGKIKGMKVCRQAMDKWEEEFDEREDPRGRKYWWLTGKFVHYDKGEDTDEWALKEGYVSVVPTQFDLTAHHGVTFLNNNWEL